MAGYSSSQGTSASQSTSFPTSIQSPQSEWGLQLSQLLSSLGQYTFNWANQQYNSGRQITDSNINNFLNMANQAGGFANNLLGRYVNTFEPLMNNFIQQASTYGSAANQAFQAGQAESTVGQADQAAMDSAQRQLQSMGINPNSGRYEDLLLAQRTQDAAARAGAGTQAALNTRNIGRQMLQTAVQLGQNVPGFAVNAINSAYTGLSGAENAILGLLNTGANLKNVPVNYLNAAANANRLPPVGQVSQSTSGSQQQSHSQQQQPKQQDGGQQQNKPSAPNQLQTNAGQGNKGPLVARAPGSNQGTGATTDQLGTYQSLYSPESAPFVDTSANAMPGGGTPFPLDPFSANEIGAANQAGNQPVDTSPWANNQNFDTSTLNPNAATQPLSAQFGQLPQVPGADQGTGNFGSPFGTQDFGAPAPGEGTDFGSPTPTTDYFGGAGPGSVTDNSGGGLGDFFGQLAGDINPITPAYGGDLSQDFQDPSINQDYMQPYDPSQGQDYGTQDYAPQDYSSQDYGTQDYSGAYDQTQSQDYGTQDYSNQDYSSQDSYSDSGGYYASGGAVRGRGAPTSGGFVPPTASPSRGRNTDDIPARLNAHEYVIPKDVVHHKGTEFFNNLIKKSRMARTGMAGPTPQGKPKPALRAPPTFTSRYLGGGGV
jgi:hypothetical protein